MAKEEAEAEATAIEAEIERLQERAKELRNFAVCRASEANDRLAALCHGGTDDAENADVLRTLIAESGLPAPTRARLYTWLADILEAGQ